MSGLLNKIRGTDPNSSEQTFSGRNNDEVTGTGSSHTLAANTQDPTLSSHGRTAGATTNTSTHTHGTGLGSTTGVSTSESNIGTAGHGVAHLGRETDQYASTQFQQNAQVHFSGRQSEANITTQNQATNVQVPGQHIEATLPAKQVIVEVPERQVEVDLPARNIQLENNPEINVSTHPNIRSVAARVEGEIEGALGMNNNNNNTTGTTGMNNSSSRIDPKTSSKY